jgi:hypothetical protein
MMEAKGSFFHKSNRYNSRFKVIEPINIHKTLIIYMIFLQAKDNLLENYAYRQKINMNGMVYALYFEMITLFSCLICSVTCLIKFCS